ncbi:MAG: leuA, partial [Sedimentibacter sp.]|nr:leuA [Sedimentibacter sp.]
MGLDKNKLVLGKHSGRHAFRDKLQQLGYKLTNEELDEAFKKFKDLADKKKDVYDKDIEALVSRQRIDVPKTYELHNYVINTGNVITPTATVSIKKDKVIREEVAT